MLPLLMLIPGLLFTGAKYVGPILENHATQLIPLLERIMGNSPTGKKIADAFESVMGTIDQDKKDKFILETDSMLGQINIEEIEATREHFFQYGARPFLFWGLSCALLMSVLVEPTINYLLGFFAIAGPNPFVLAPSVIAMLSGLCGLYMVGRTVEKHSGTN